MPSRYTVMVTSPVTITTTTETVVATAPAFSYNNPGTSGVSISGVINLTMGTAGTGSIIRVRQGSLTGPIVGVSGGTTQTEAAAAVANIPFEVEDTSGFYQAANSIYVVTVQPVAATGNSTVNQATIEVAGA
jgi:hypothetical protein